MRGGKRSGAGRPAKPKVVLPVLSKQLAIDLYLDPSTKKRWQELRDAKTLKGEPDLDLRFRVEREIQDQAAGKSVQPISHKTDGPISVDVRIRRVGA